MQSFLHFLRVSLGLGLFLLGSPELLAQGTRILRQPTLSDQHIVFVYANDLWIVSKEGGDARRLTSSEGAETLPHFSPNGQNIAFTAQYDGNTDVYTVPLTGGQPKRLTWHPGADRVCGWTPDGNSVLFSSGREGIPTQEQKFFTVSTQGGMPQALRIPRATTGEISPDGQYAAYQMISFWDPEWRNYRGGQAKPIWVVNLKDLSLIRTPQTDQERHTDPVWLGNRVFFLSERDFANNIWSFDPQTKDLKQHTKHADFDVKSLDAHGDQIVYEQGGYLHLLNPESNETKQLTIQVRGDFHWARERWDKINPQQLINARLSPSGQRALFEYRGEIFTAPQKEGDWRNISQDPSAADRYPVWSPDGSKIAWFSDASGEYQLHIRDQEGLNPARAIALPNPSFYFRPDWSPDGKYIAYTDTDYNLWYVNVNSGEAKKVDTERYAHPNRSLNPVWSPDSKWIAYARLLENQFKVIKAHQVETGKTIQLTDGMSDAISPVWDATGKYLYFLASTNYGLNSGWLDMSSYEHPIERGLYLIVLSKDEPSPLAPLSDEEENKSDSESKAKENDKPVVKIDEDGLSQRILALDIPERNYTALHPGPKSHIFYVESVPNQRGVNLHRYSLKKRKSEVFLTGINYGNVSLDRKKLIYRKGSSWSIVGTAASPPKAGTGKLKLSSMRMKVNPMAEWKQIFREGWRYQRDFLYVENVHGAPWDKVYSWYSPWVDHVRHRSDLNYLVDIIGGEVAVGHSYTRGGDFPDIEFIPIGLLGADFKADKGYYQIEKIYTGENWNPNFRAPLSGPGMHVSAGDYLISVNGLEVKPPQNLYQYFEASADRQIKILVNDKPSREGARTLTVIPVRSEFSLRRFDWIEGNRKKVDELSNGELAYVYVPNTFGQGYAYFNRYYFAQQHKKGAVIDERNNGGGSAADYMVDVMARNLHGYFNSRANDHRPFTTPGAGIWGPKVMIINERAGSGGDLLPYLFRKMEIGPLVGTRTWGGLVGTWDTPRFIDGGRMVAPRGGFYDLNGEWAVEGEGIAPDVEVIQDPAKIANGEDPQLERAVQEALKLIPTQTIKLKPEPPAPVRWKRPGSR